MRKILFFPVVLAAINVYGQTPPPAEPVKKEFIVPVQMGTDTLKNGKAEVAMSELTTDEMKQAHASPDYTVVLTPIGDCGPLTLAETSTDHFTVKQQKGTSGSPKGSFSYIVYVKQQTPQVLPHAPKPPTPEELAQQHNQLHVDPIIPPPQQPGQPAPPQPGQIGPTPPLPGQPPPGPGNMPH